MSEFIINLGKVKENYLKLKDLLPKQIIAYALKANYDEKILRTLASEGCYAEACSLYEFEKADKAGFDKIILNGFHTKNDLIKIKNAFLINVESAKELSILKEIKYSGLIGARIKIKENSKLGLTKNEILNNKFDCVSFHTGTQFKEEDFFNNLKTANELAEKVGAKYIDVGGGYGERINETFIKKVLASTNKKLIIEPGRLLVGNACELICDIIEIKGSNIIIDTGFNFLSKISESKYEVEVIGKEKNIRNKVYSICGPIPTDLDSIGKYSLPIISENDKIKIKNCGAYTLSLASKFTRELPKIIYNE